MTADPRRLAGWFPQLSRSGQHCLSTWIGDNDPALGRRPCASIVDGAVIHADGYGGAWETDDTVILYSYRYQGLVRWTLGAADVRPVEGPTRAGGNSLAAAAGRHIIGVQTPQRSYLVWDDGRVIEDAGSPTLSDDGQHLAYLRHADKALVLDGQVIDPGPCDQPRFGDNTLMWERNAQVMARSTPEQPTRALTPPLGREFKPIAAWTGRDLPYLAHTDSGVHLRLWGLPRGWPVYDGITDGPHHARATDKTHVRCVWSVGGELRERTIDLDSATVDLTPPVVPPDTPFVAIPGAVIEDLLPRLLAQATARRDNVIFFRKSDPIDWGAWHDWNETYIGLLADNSGPGDKPVSMYFAPNHAWFPRRAVDGWELTYRTRFIWSDGTPTTDETIHLTMRVGHGVYQGQVVDCVLIYDPRHPDLHDLDEHGEPKRKTGWQERTYLGPAGYVRFEAYKDDANGNLVLDPASVAQPYPVGKDTPFPSPPRPTPYDPILSTETAPTITITRYGRVGDGAHQGQAPFAWEGQAARTGEVDRIVWRWRLQGTSTWTTKDDDEHTTVTFTTPGTYEIGVDCWGPGGHDGTTRPRLITVTA